MTDQGVQKKFKTSLPSPTTRATGGADQTHEKLYGWFSQLAMDSGVPTLMYDTPRNVHALVTNISGSPTDSTTVWKDVTCVGEVTNFIKKSV